MSRLITSEIVTAYADCPRKAYLLLCTNTRGTPHEHSQILKKQQSENQHIYFDRLQSENIDVQPYSSAHFKRGYDFLINATLRTDTLAADCPILTKVSRMNQPFL